MGQKDKFLFFYSSLQCHKYGTRLRTQRICGHVLQNTSEYPKTSAPRCLQTLYHLKQDEKQQNLKRRKSRGVKTRSQKDSLCFFFHRFSSPLSLISTHRPYCPDFPSGHRSESPDAVLVTASPGVFPPVYVVLNQPLVLLGPAVPIPVLLQSLLIPLLEHTLPPTAFTYTQLIKTVLTFLSVNWPSTVLPHFPNTTTDP